MPNQIDRNIIRVPGTTVIVKVDLPEREGSATATTLASFTSGFDNVRRYLSGKPLRRPNRTAPINH